MSGGPLSGVRIVEVASIGPGPFAGMMLADMGADLVRLERVGGDALGSGAWQLVNRGRPSVGIDLKQPAGVELALRLCESADGLIEGFRPGVMERLGLGPDVCLERNPRLVYGRMTGYGQDGPLSSVAGHDITYIAIAGALGAIARHGEPPLAPLNLVGDYGGGGMLLAFGMVCAILEARVSGLGQVVDAAMVEGAAVLTTMFHALRQAGVWSDEPGTNAIDSGAHFYEVYETADGGHVAVGAIEPQFYAELLRILEIDPAQAPQFERERWPELKQRFAEVFRTRTRAEWAALLEHAEACAAPVLSLAEAPSHPHNRAREVFVERSGAIQPAPAPRFSRTSPQLGRPASDPGADTDEALAAWGISEREIAGLRDSGAISGG
jgi:alpha-methylacyl-CoA racemase